MVYLGEAEQIFFKKSKYAIQDIYHSNEAKIDYNGDTENTEILFSLCPLLFFIFYTTTNGAGFIRSGGFKPSTTDKIHKQQPSFKK
jgi:SET domain-containing protein